MTELDSEHRFSTTHWSLVLKARDGDTIASAEALEKLCRTYWPALYAYTRRQGHAPEEAQDLTQEFFVWFLEKDYLAHLRHREGKFRSFLLTFLKHFLSDQRHRAQAQKRGGGQRFISLDEFTAEEQECFGAASGLTAEQIFERRWAQALLEQAANRLRQEYLTAGKLALFEHLKDLPLGEHGNPTYAEIGAGLGMSEAAIKSAAHRLRQRHRHLLRELIASTLQNPTEIDEEIRYLIGVLGASRQQFSL